VHNLKDDILIMSSLSFSSSFIDAAL